MEAKVDAIDSLLAGNKRFREGKFKSQTGIYQKLAEDGQFPSALVITCSDSRVLMHDIFDSDPGNLFVVRNIAGFVPAINTAGECAGTLSAIEFAVNVLKVKAAIVMTHSHCAGVAKASSDELPQILEEAPMIGRWLKAMDMPRNEGHMEDAERLAARRSLSNLADIPSVKSAFERGELQLAAMRVDFEAGQVEVVEQLTT